MAATITKPVLPKPPVTQPIGPAPISPPVRLVEWIAAKPDAPEERIAIDPADPYDRIIVNRWRQSLQSKGYWVLAKEV